MAAAIHGYNIMRLRNAENMFNTAQNTPSIPPTNPK